HHPPRPPTEADAPEHEGLTHDAQEPPPQRGHEPRDENAPVWRARQPRGRKSQTRQEADARHEDPVEPSAEEEQGHTHHDADQRRHGPTLAPRADSSPGTPSEAGPNAAARPRNRQASRRGRPPASPPPSRRS